MMKINDEYLEMFDDVEENSNEINKPVLEDSLPEQPGPKEESLPGQSINPEDEYGYLKTMLGIQRKFDDIQEKQSLIGFQMEAVKDIRVSLKNKDHDLIKTLPQEVITQTKIALEAYLPNLVKQAVKEINESKESACKEIQEIRDYTGKGIWISNKNLYIATIIVLSSICFGGWGVSFLEDQGKSIVYWMIVLVLPVSLLVRWFVKEKLFPKDDRKYPWR